MLLIQMSGIVYLLVEWDQVGAGLSMKENYLESVASGKTDKLTRDKLEGLLLEALELVDLQDNVIKTRTNSWIGALIVLAGLLTIQILLVARLFKDWKRSEQPNA